MWEYNRVDANFGSYKPNTFFKLINSYGKEGWEIIDYKEFLNNGTNYRFVVVMKRKLRK